MKEKNTIKENLIVWIFLFVFIGIIFLIHYLEENYEVSKYLFIFNIGCLVIMPLYYFIYYYKEKRNTKKLENETIIKNIDFKYYKDIIDEYSPAMLSIILDGSEFEKDLAGSVIYLINKGYLEIQDKNKIIRTNKDYSKLTEDLKILCDSDLNQLMACTRINNKTDEEKHQAKMSSETRGKWINAVEKQIVEKGLATEKNGGSAIILLVIYIFGILEVTFSLFVESYGLLLLSIIVTFLLMYLRFLAYDKNKFVKTQKGYELYTKVVGLKNYIKDYSNLSESELREITIWEDYLIYAIIFNNISKLNKETMDYYKKICNIRDEKQIMKMKKIPAILSIIISLFGIRAYWNSTLPIGVITIITLLNFFLIQKGKNYKKIITIIGYVLNIVLLALVILEIFLELY